MQTGSMSKVFRIVENKKERLGKRMHVASSMLGVEAVHRSKVSCHLNISGRLGCSEALTTRAHGVRASKRGTHAAM
jgi:glucose-6-phosphate dehydrogenase assembly protein OpcA